jgi:hypothetical protein
MITSEEEKKKLSSLPDNNPATISKTLHRALIDP